MIKKNDVIAAFADDQVTHYRVLWLAPDNAKGVAIVMDVIPTTKLRLPFFFDVQSLLADGARILESDPFTQRIIEWQNLLKEERARYEADAAKAYELIRSIAEFEKPQQFYRKVRGRLTKSAAKAHRVAETTVRRKLSRWYQRGCITPYALIPDYHLCKSLPATEQENAKKRGRYSAEEKARGHRTNVVISAKIQRYILLGWSKWSQLGRVEARQNTLEEYFHVGFRADGSRVLPPSTELFTQRQFDYCVGKWRSKNPVEDVLLRETDREFQLNHRALNTHFKSYGPGSIYLIDCTTADIYLVSVIDRRKLVGRPIVYLVEDVFSRLIVGIWITLENASYLAVAAALYNAFENKVRFCSRHGIDILPEEWPAQGIPGAVFADRGELIEKNADWLNVLGLTLENAPPYRPDAKALLERRFKTLNDVSIHWLPGAVRGPAERGDRDYRLDAKLDIHQFTKLVIHTVLYHNRTPLSNYPAEADLLADGIVPVPADLWNWGIRYRSGHLSAMDPELIRLNLLPRSPCSVTSMGVKFKGHYYSSERAVREQWSANARINGRSRILASYDPRYPQAIYLPIGGRYEQFDLSDVENSAAGRACWDELELHHQDHLENKSAREDVILQSKAKRNAKTQAIVDEATAQTNAALAAAPLTKAARTKDIRANKRRERELERTQNAPAYAATKPPLDPAKVIPFHSADGGGAELSQLRDLLKRPKQ